MSSQKYLCSACHAPLSIHNRFEKVVKCSYCGTVNYIIDESLDLSGKTGTLFDSTSIFQVGKQIEFLGKTGNISARIRYEYKEGFWEEFYIETNNGEKIFLQEDEGELTLFQKKSLTTPIPEVSNLSAGMNIQINNENFFITEISTAHIQGVEGSLPYRVNSKEEIIYIDGNIAGKISSLEISNSEIFYCEGKEIGYDEIKIL